MWKTNQMMTITDYHADTTHASKSALDILARSPYEYWCRKVFPQLKRADPFLADPVPQHVRQQWHEEEQGRHFVIGNAVDCLLLEPHDFGKRFFVTTHLNRSTREGKAAHIANVTANAGKQWLKPDEHRDVVAMVQAINDSWISAFVNPSTAQRTITWEDGDTGVKCKCRPDWLLTLDDAFWANFIEELQPEQNWLSWLLNESMGLDANNQPHGLANYDDLACDLKTLNGRWESHVVDYRYHVQAPFYLDGINAAMNDGKRRAFIFITVDTAWPHSVHMRFLPPAAMRIGRAEYRRNLAQLAECRHSGEWPKGGDTFTETDMPSWFMFKNRNV